MASHTLYGVGARVMPLRTSWHSVSPGPARWQFLVRCLHGDSLTSEQLRARKMRRVSAMYYVPSPSTTDPSSIIPKLPQLVLEDREILRKALIVASPGLARWFEKGNPFLQDAMSWMYSPVVPGALPTSYVAIVDSLPDPQYFEEWYVARNRPFPPAEGFAICLLSDVVSRERTDGDHNGPAVLRVISQKSDIDRRDKQTSTVSKGVFSSLTIPLANTLFVNGSRNTAFKLKWSATEDEKSLQPSGDPTPVELVQFNVFRDPRHIFHHCVPLHALTKPRQVVSSMGNVIREVQGDDDKLIRASAELESEVPKFLAQREEGEDDIQIQVFARVMPPDTKHQDSHFTSTYHALWRGGHMYRVTSGGGGWGKKAGLLSLDPATNFAPLISTEQSMFPDPDAEETGAEEPPDLGALVPAGHTIQFFAAKILPPDPPYFAELPDNPEESSSTSSYLPEKWSRMKSQKVQQLVFGNTMSSDVPVSGTPTKEERLASIQAVPGCFGALSEGGASVAVLKRTVRDPTLKSPKGKDFHWDVVNEFRIDAPFATFKSLISKTDHQGKRSDATAQSSATTPGEMEHSQEGQAEFPPLRTKKPRGPVKIVKYTVDKQSPKDVKSKVIRKVNSAPGVTK